MHNYCMRQRSWYNVPRASIPDGKRCKMSLGLEPSLRAGSLWRYGIIKVGRNASAFLENAADKRRMRTALGSVHGIMVSLQTTRGVRGPGKLAVGRNDIVAAIRNPFYPPPSTL